jgi:hypothetical protein
MREVLQQMHREFVYIGEPVPELNKQEYAAFILQFQKAMLASLKKRGLLNHSQYERCVDKLENNSRRNVS